MARDSADPVPVTEAEPIPSDEIPLLETGRDLRPDTITPSPDITSSAVEAFEPHRGERREVLAEDEEFASRPSAEEAETRSRSFGRCCIRREHGRREAVMLQ